MNHCIRIFSSLFLALISFATFADATGIDAELQALTREFDAARYDLPSGDARVKALESVRVHAAALETKYPKRAEPLVWQAWALDEQAEVDRGFSSLSFLKQARKKLEAAIEVDPTVYGADAYSLLGGLYAQLPGFPLSYGNEKKGREYLLKALALNPTGAQPNLGFARYHLKIGDYVGVIKYASAALIAPPRLDREKADANLHKQAAELIAQSKAKTR